MVAYKWLLFGLAACVAAQVLITAPPDATVTEAPRLEKRIEADHIANQRQKIQDAQNKIDGITSASSTGLARWIRTIYGSQVEIVTPTVIQGVTFNAKPPKTTDGLENWISLDNNGSPKTIKPKLKDGRIKNASPTYGTWFATPTTVRYTKEELKAHNMDENDVLEVVEYTEEDLTYHSLNPLIRCTPDFYKKKGINKQSVSAPFCFPQDNAVLKVDRTYFITWYSRFFKDAEKARIHLSMVRPSLKDKGLKKRSKIIDNGGKVTKVSFFTTDWVSNDQGFYPLYIDNDWFKNNELTMKVLISIQPDNVPDDEFDYMKNSLVVEMIIGGSVYRGHNEDLKLLEEQQKFGHLVEEEEGLDYEKYFAIMGIPLAVCVIAFLMYIFVWFNKVDLSHLKKRKFAGKNTTHRRIPFVGKKTGYASLPAYNSDVEMKALGKHD